MTVGRVVSVTGRGRITHPQGQLAQLVRLVGQAMRLQVEHELQPVFDLAKKSIGVIQNAIFQIGQAADLFERAHGLERVALADFGQVAAVERAAGTGW